jgi:leader peptidase (prepilin peptidase)/N-methyltransferase
MDLIFSITFFLFGLAFGSFLNVCIYRMPRDLSVVSPGSACPKCGHGIRAYDNVPVLSWLLLGGRCRDCRAPISPRYIAVELLTGVLFAGCYLHFGSPLLVPNRMFFALLVAAKFCIFGFLSLGLIFTDAETKLLPDKLTLTGLAAGLILSALVPIRDFASELLPLIVPHTAPISWRLLSFADAVLGAAVGAGFVYGSGMVYKLARGVEGMGFGDVKLMAMVGAFLGVTLTVGTIFAASMLGAIYGLSMIPVVWVKRTRRRMIRGHEPAALARRRAWNSAKKVYRYYAMPFGVFLGSIAILAAFFGDDILRWYWRRYL